MWLGKQQSMGGIGANNRTRSRPHRSLKHHLPQSDGFGPSACFVDISRSVVTSGRLLFGWAAYRLVTPISNPVQQGSPSDFVTHEPCSLLLPTDKLISPGNASRNWQGYVTMPVDFVESLKIQCR